MECFIMLLEISCAEFKSNGVVRPKITFHNGLNTVLGGLSADNSIGKSTLLLIIDFAFGGTTYNKNSEVATHIGGHSINFAFQFGTEVHYFSRSTISPDKVSKCDDQYTPTEEITTQDFCKLLFSLYNLDIKGMSFRQILSRFMRVYGKDNCEPTRPLHSFHSEKGEDIITSLEKLFDVYWKIEQHKAEVKKRTDEQKVYNSARKLEFIPNDVTTKTESKNNEKMIAQLQEELETLAVTQDQDLSLQDLALVDEVSAFKLKLANLRRQRTKLKTKLNLLLVNLNSEFPYVPSDFLELSEFFPELNIKKIEEVEIFHKKMVDILSGQLSEEVSILQHQVSVIEGELLKLEESQRELGHLVNIPKNFLDQYSEKTHQITGLQLQNKAYTDMNTHKDGVKEAKNQKKEAEEKELDVLKAQINAELVRLDDFVSNQSRIPPVIDLKGDKYAYETPNDTGTGTAYKSLVLLDLAILRLTTLPLLVHDSLLLNNIGYTPLEKLIELYNQSEKQIFIAFDREEAPTPEIQKILDKTTVIHLSAGGNELFGKSWGEKNSTK